MNKALVGKTPGATGVGPLMKIGTVLHHVLNGDDSAVGNAIAKLGNALATHAESLDFLSFSLARVQK